MNVETTAEIPSRASVPDGAKDEERTMNPTLNPLLAEQHPADLVRPARQYRRVHSEPRTRRDGAPTRWISLAHAALNQAKMAAPRTATASSSSSAHCYA